MEHDLWRQWQAFAALATPPSASRGAPAFGIAPFIEAGERFSAAARTFFNGKHGESAAAGESASAGAAAQTFSDFLRDQFADFFKPPWTAGLGPDPAAIVSEAPALGSTREHQQRAQRLAEAWRRTDDAQRRLQRLWFDTLREAASAFAGRPGPPQAAPLSADALNRLYDAWIDCAEEAYARTAHSEAFCIALADFVNASSQWRREFQASVDEWAKLIDLPTRDEINTLAQRLRSVEDQLRAMRRSQVKPPGAARKSRRIKKTKP